MSKNARHLATVAVLVIIVTFPVYFLLNAIYQLPVAASRQADQIQPLFDVHFMLISALFSLIVVIMLYSFVVFRQKPGDDSEAAQFHGNTPLEIIWTILPLGIVIALGVWGAIVLSDVTAAESNEMPVQVIGRQWSWVFAYPEHEDVGFVDEMVIPVNRPIRLEMQSQDVLHSFWVPEFRVKQDLVPGMTNILHITPTKEGEYQVGCAEICGTNHALMLANVRVVSQAEFDAFIAERGINLAELTPAERGEKWASDYGCTGCHSTDGSTLAGPTWKDMVGHQATLEDGSSVLVDEAYISESIQDPSAKIVSGFTNVMPANFADRISADQADLLASKGVEVDIIADLIAYMQTLSQ